MTKMADTMTDFRLNKLVLFVLAILMFNPLVPGRLWAKGVVLTAIDIQDSVKRIRFSVTGKVPEKVIRVDAKEVLIALKNIDIKEDIVALAVSVAGKTRKEWLKDLQVEKLPGGVMALMITGTRPFKRVKASWDKAGRHLIVDFGDGENPSGKKQKSFGRKHKSRVPNLKEKGQRFKKNSAQAIAVQQKKDRPIPIKKVESPREVSEVSKKRAPKEKQTEYIAPVRSSSPFIGDITDLLSQVDLSDCRSEELKTVIGYLKGRMWAPALSILTAHVDNPANQCLGQVRYLKAFAAMKAAEKDGDRIYAASCFKEALVAHPASTLVPFAYTGLGLLHLKLNNPAVAEGYFNLVQQGYPEYPGLAQVLYHLGDILETRGFPDQAMALFRQVFEKMPENIHTVDAGLGMGKIFYKKRRYIDALNMFQHLLKANPEKVYDSSELLFNIGNAHLQLGNSREARENLLRCYNLFPDVRGRDMIMNSIGDTYALEKNIDRAMAVYRLVMDQFPGGEGFLASSMGLARYLEDRVEKEKLYINIKTNFPDHRFASIAMMRLAEIYEQAGEFNRAIEEIESLLATHPRGLRYEAVKLMQRAYEALFEQQRKSAQYPGVIQRYEAEHVLIDRMESEKIFYSVGLSYLKANLYEPAFNHLLNSYKRYKRSDRPSELLFGLGVAMDESERDDDALKILEGFTRRFPKHGKKAEAYFRMGTIFREQGAFKKAVRKYEQACQASQEYLQRAEILKAHAFVFSSQDQWKKVSPLLKRAAEEYVAAPGNQFEKITNAYRDLGESYRHQKMYVKAADAFALAMTFTGDDTPQADLGFMLGDAYQKGNVLEKAKEVFKKIAGTDDSIWARMAKERLDTLELAEKVKNS